MQRDSLSQPRDEGITSEEARRQLVRRMGLPEDTTWDQIEIADRENIAMYYGLPRDATYAQIREEAIRQLGLPNDADWAQIRKAKAAECRSTEIEVWREIEEIRTRVKIIE